MYGERTPVHFLPRRLSPRFLRNPPLLPYSGMSRSVPRFPDNFRCWMQSVLSGFLPAAGTLLCHPGFHFLTIRFRLFLSPAFPSPVFLSPVFPFRPLLPPALPSPASLFHLFRVLSPASPSLLFLFPVLRLQFRCSFQFPVFQMNPWNRQFRLRYLLRKSRLQDLPVNCSFHFRFHFGLLKSSLQSPAVFPHKLQWCLKVPAPDIPGQTQPAPPQSLSFRIRIWLPEFPVRTPAARQSVYFPPEVRPPHNNSMLPGSFLRSVLKSDRLPLPVPLLPHKLSPLQVLLRNHPIPGYNLLWTSRLSPHI